MSRFDLNSIPIIRIFFFLTLSFNVLSQDNTPPTITIPAQSVNVSCSGGNTITLLTSWYQNFANSQATDDSGTAIFNPTPSLNEAIFQFENSMGPCGKTKIVMVNFIAEDPSGNQSEDNFASFSSIDNIDPVIVVEPEDVTIQCTSNVRDSLINWIKNHGNAVALDDCSDTLFWTDFVSNLPPVGTFPIDEGPYPILPIDKCDLTINVTFFVEDECGNRLATTGAYTIVDEIGPKLSALPQDTLVSCSELPPPPNITAFDSCYGEVTVVFNEDSNRSSDYTQCEYYNYDIIRSWTANDFCGNVTTHVQNINIRDLEPPIIEVTSPLVVGCNDIFASNAINLVDTLYDDCTDSLFLNIIDTGDFQDCNFTIFRVYSVEDICGNETSIIQNLLVRDETPPVIASPARDTFFACDSNIDFEAAFEEWLSDNASSSSSDECSDLNIFPAIPGSYDPNDPNSLPGIHPSNLNLATCPSGINGLIRYEEVDFLHIDICQNVSVTTATFGILDSIPPVIVNCPPNRSYDLTGMDCAITVKELFPSGTDNCTSITSPIVSGNSANISSASPGNPLVLVDSVFLRIGPFDLTSFSVAEEGTLTITISDIDAEDPEEYFNIFDERGNLLGTTPILNQQCSDSTFSISGIAITDLMEWLEDDSFIDFSFQPNSPTNAFDGINDVCGNSAIEAVIEFPIIPIPKVIGSYTINGSARFDATINDSIDIILEVGSNSIEYYIEDCAENPATCIQTINVNDNIPPTLDCGDSLTLAIGLDSCKLDFNIPIDFTVTENCSLNEVYNVTEPKNEDAQLITFEYDTLNQRHLAVNRLITFNNVSQIAFGNTPVRLQIEVTGDINEPGETFNIIGEGGAPLGVTPSSAGLGCGTSVREIQIPTSAFNIWAMDNKVEILLTTSQGPAIEGGGINPCVPIDSSQSTDGVSRIKANLKYFDANLHYTINNDTTTYTVSPNADSLNLVLESGSYNFNFTISDLGGNETTCVKNITIIDTISPTAICKDMTIQVHPSGVLTSEIIPDSIDMESFDNCQIDSIFVLSEIINCSNVGDTVEALLIAEDKAGYKDTCSASIHIEPYTVQPSFTSGICSGDTLDLFANLPDDMGYDINNYQIEWYKNGELISTELNPQLTGPSTELNGMYSIRVSGDNGCQSEGEILVNIIPFNKPQLTSNKTKVCVGEKVTLSTIEFTGLVVYSWYEGVFPNGSLVGTSAINEFSINVKSGIRTYYVIANNVDCETPPSDSLEIEGIMKPDAMVANAFLSVCDGGLIALESTNMEPELTFNWTGPNGFMSDQRIPSSIIASSSTVGHYKLVVSSGDCVSDTALVSINLLSRPGKPIITGESIYCEGSTFSLAVNNITNGTTYQWFRNGLLYTTTQDNSLDVPNAQIGLTGDWAVVIIRDGCPSEVSDPISITVDDLINVGASNDGPVCIGDSVTITATFVPNASYEWEGPNFNGSGQVIKIPAVPGDYSVTITTATNCSNVATTEVVVNPAPEITALSSNNPGCVDENTVITFSPTIFPSGSYQYQWTGPNGFNSDQLNPSITDIDENDKGTYTLISFLEGCPSEPLSINLDFDITPNTPTINGDIEICDGQQIVLTSSTSANSYTWITPLGNIITGSSIFTINNVSEQNEGSYSLIISNGSCPSEESNSLNITINDIPLSPIISGLSDVCFGDTIILTSNILNAEEFIWTLPDNSTFNGPTLEINDASQNNAGSYQLFYVLNGCDSRISNNFMVNVRDSIVTPAFLKESLSFCSDLSNAEEICLNPNSMVMGGFYTLENVTTGETIASGNELCFTITNSDGFTNGLNELIVITEVDGCLSRISEPISIFFQAPPSIIASVMNDFYVVCDMDEFVTLTAAHGPPDVDVEWIGLTPGVDIIDPMMSSTIANNFLPGENLIRLTYSKDGCNEFTSDTISIFLEPQPMVVNDTYEIHYNSGAISLDVLNNDNLPTNYTFSILSNDTEGTLTISGNEVIFTPNFGALGDQTFKYETCVDGCPDLCSSGDVTIEIGGNIACELPSIITPNDDGINDRLIIPCLQSGNYPNNKLYIFNEWGDEIYSTVGYDNTWAGTYGGENVPAGTYFIVFEPGGLAPSLRGFLIIQR
jgi:gliding motility-associated-like protein